MPTPPTRADYRRPRVPVAFERGAGQTGMVTPEEIGQISVFACLDPADRERVCRATADINLSAGEFAAHEGDERALFAVLEGQIEATRMVDGIHRQIGIRNPGDFFGELPVTLGTVFPVDFRAVEARGDADRAERLPRPRVVNTVDRRRGREAGVEPHRRPWRPAGPRRHAREATRVRARPPLGRRLRRVAPLPRPQPDHVPMAAAGHPGGGRAVVGRPAGRGRLPRPPDRQREDGGAPAAAPGGRDARGPDRAERGGVRHRDRRRRPRGAGSGCVRSVRGPRDDCDRA